MSGASNVKMAKGENLQIAFFTMMAATVPAVEKGLNTFYEKYFEITVEDTGSVSQEKIELIFDKYYTSKSVLLDTAGKGIGLSYIKDLVYLMQGEIRVESQLEKGSTFFVYLPVIPTKETSQTPVTTEKPMFKLARQEASLLLNTYLEEGAEIVENDDSPNTSLPHIMSFRMKKAKDLLAQQNLTIAEVAYKVGFDLPNSFSRTFKKEFNITSIQFVVDLQQKDSMDVDVDRQEYFSKN